jgi:hypothetical protein
VTARRALISKDDLDRMACAVAAHGVVFKGCVDPQQNIFTFSMEPGRGAGLPRNDDLDDRLDRWAGQ